MSYQKLRHYHQAESTSVSKLVQVAILLEYCAQLLQRTLIAIDQGDIEERFNTTDKVTVVISSIQGALAVERSEDAQALNTFFQNVISILIRINTENDKEMCELLRERLLEMGSIWRSADRTLTPQQPQEIMGVATGGKNM